MFNWIISLVFGAVVAFAFGVYMVALGLTVATVAAVSVLIFGYTSAVIALLLDGE